LPDRELIVVNEIVFAVLGELLLELIVADFKVFLSVGFISSGVLQRIKVVMMDQSGFLR
jgi:hypothetical protein